MARHFIINELVQKYFILSKFFSHFSKLIYYLSIIKILLCFYLFIFIKIILLFLYYFKHYHYIILFLLILYLYLDLFIYLVILITFIINFLLKLFHLIELDKNSYIIRKINISYKCLNLGVNIFIIIFLVIQYLYLDKIKIHIRNFSKK